MSNTIIRRNGRQTEQISVELPKPPERYVSGETLKLQINGVDEEVIVEVTCGDCESGILHVA